MDQQTHNVKPAPRTYTPTELARLCGVPVNVVYDGKSGKTKGESLGSKAYQLAEYMREHNITWVQIVPSSSGKRTGAQTKPAATSHHVVQADNVVSPATAEHPIPDPQDATYPKPGDLEMLAVNKSTEIMEYPSLHAYQMEHLVAEIIRRVPRAEVVLR